MQRQRYHSLCTFSLSLVVLSLLLLGTSTEAWAQDALLNRYDQLYQQWEVARKVDANGSTAATRATLERTSQALADFKRANGAILEEALTARRGRAAPGTMQERGDPGARPIFSQMTYTSTDTPLGISTAPPPSANITSTIFIADTGVITDIDASVDITHSWVGDLNLTLRHVDTGTAVTLLDRPGQPALHNFGCGDDNMDVLFDDESSDPDLENLCSGPPPTSFSPWYAGDAPPVGSLSDFDGEDLSGAWELIVTDNAGGDGGALEGWSLIATIEQIDLSLTKTCDANDNGTGTFDLTVANAGPADATGVVVIDWLPPLIGNVQGNAGQGTFDAITGFWSVGDLDAGSSASLSISFSFDPNIAGEYVNHAEVVAADQDDSDSTPGDDEGDDFAECGFVVLPDRTVADFVPESGPGGVIERGRRFEADLEVTKAVDVATAPVGAMVHYTVTLGNNGPHSTSKVQVTDNLPECLTDATWEASRGTYDGSVWDLGAVKVGASDSLTVWATVGATCAGTVTNQAWVSRSSLPDPQVNPNDPSALPDPFTTPETILNNRASASFDVEAGASARVLDGATFALGRNYPNPFNPTTVVPFSLAEAAHVAIKVYDLLGREVAVLVDGALSAGVHEVAFEASHLPTGVYLIRMDAAGLVQIQRVTLMK